MGWLDNSTNNIILDAVLTDYGRQALARNDGSFKVARFALGDDEVDYSLIKKYGRTVGAEKIEKNVPVFEAFTNQNLGLKHRLISVPKPLLYLPVLGRPDTTPIQLATSGTRKPTAKSINIQQILNNGEVVDDQVRDAAFEIYVPDRFLRINQISMIGRPDVSGIAMYEVPADRNLTPYQGGQITFTLGVKTISTTTFSIYGTLQNGVYTINTTVRVVGKSSGSSMDLPVTISSNSTSTIA
jgi:hypothetical protein